MYVEVECDRCGKKMRLNDIMPKYTLVLWIRKCGWSVGRKILCQQCREIAELKFGNRKKWDA